MGKMGYDSCYEISDVDSFFHHLKDPALGAFLGWHKVSYEEKEMHYTTAKAKNPAVIKEPCFEYQKECRALWLPQGDPIAPHIIFSNAAAKLIKCVDF